MPVAPPPKTGLDARARRQPDRVIELPKESDLDWLRKPWLDLVRRTGGSYFQTPDWVMGWWETIGRRGAAMIALWNGGAAGTIDAVVPLFRHRERLHRSLPFTVAAWTNLGSGHGGADHLGFPMTSARQPDVRQWLLSLRGDTTLFLRNLAPDQSRQLALPDGLIVERTRCPRVDLATDQVPPTFRKKLIYYRRRLTAEHVSFESIDAAHIEPRHLDMLFDLHERRWSTTAVGSSSRLRDRRALLLDLARRGTAEHGPRLVLARHADQVIGALLGFSHFGTFSYFQTGWDPAWRSRNIGTSMVAEAMDRAKGDGAETFDFLRGTSEYKYQFGATDEVDETWLLPSGVSGRLLKWKYTTGRSVARITARSPRQLRRPQSPGE